MDNTQQMCRFVHTQVWALDVFHLLCRSAPAFSARSRNGKVVKDGLMVYSGAPAHWLRLSSRRQMR
eukprot:5895328-Pleurochrysis_carterae.AAC.1